MKGRPELLGFREPVVDGRCDVCTGAGMRGLKKVVARAIVATGSRETAPEVASMIPSMPLNV